MNGQGPGEESEFVCERTDEGYDELDVLLRQEQQQQQRNFRAMREYQEQRQRCLLEPDLCQDNGLSVLLSAIAQSSGTLDQGVLTLRTGEVIDLRPFSKGPETND
jgi:hypothetical protein